MGNMSPASKIFPSISVKETLGTVSNLEVEYIGDIYAEGVHQQRVRLGSAFLNLVHASSVYRDNFTFAYKELSLRMIQSLTEFENFVNAVRSGVHKVSGKIAILDQIEILTQYRGKGLFKGFLWLVLKALKENFEVDYVFLKAAPYGIDVNNRNLFLSKKNRLENMYFKNGFQKFQTNKQIKTREGGGYIINYLYINLTKHDYSEFYW